MKNNLTPAPSQPPFGTYSLSPFRNRLREIAGHWRPSIRFISSVFRKASKLGLREPFDVEPLDGFRVRVFPSNNATDKKVYMGLSAGPGNPDIDAIGKSVAATDKDTFNFLDLGGNSGMYTIAAAQAAKRAGKEFRVVIIEANPDMVERLTFNLGASEVPGATIVGSAVSDKEGTVFLSLAKNNLGQAKLVSEGEGAKVVEVPSRLLEDILDEANMTQIDFLKVDIEGHEVPALEPYLKSVSTARYPNRILIEIDHDKDNEIDRLLTSFGYETIEDLGGDIVYEFRGSKK